MNTEYNYDKLGRQASLTAPHGATYAFSLDSADRMQSIAIPGEGVIAYSEYQWHQPTRIEFPGQTVRTQSFDGLQRHQSIQVTNQAEQTLMDYAYTWDETGNIRAKNTEHGPYLYNYDDIDRLVEAEYPTFSTEAWTYDPLGNRITDARTGEEPWQYNENNELIDSVEYSFEYDDNGSLIAEYHPDGTLYRSHEYNAETRLIAVRDANDNLIAEYTYDPFGRRTSKTVYDPPGQNPETTWYLHSDQGLMAELDEQGNELDFYLFPPDGLWSTDPILRRSGASYFYYQTDHLGTPQQLVDRTGNVVHSREMRAFGEVVESGIEDRLRFPGQLHSQETGLFYNFHRDYAPGLGRYAQSDPIGLAGGANLYVYVKNRSITSMDPTGLIGWDFNDIPWDWRKWQRTFPASSTVNRERYRQGQLNVMARNNRRGSVAELVRGFLCRSMGFAVERQIDEIFDNLNEEERRLSDCNFRCYKIWVVLDRHADNVWCASRAVYSVTPCPFPNAFSNTPNNSRRFMEIDSGVLMNQTTNTCCVGGPSD